MDGGNNKERNGQPLKCCTVFIRYLSRENLIAKNNR